MLYDEGYKILEKEAHKRGWKYYSIVEDSYTYDNGLLLIGYADEKSMRCETTDVVELGTVVIDLDREKSMATTKDPNVPIRLQAGDIIEFNDTPGKYIITNDDPNIFSNPCWECTDNHSFDTRHIYLSESEGTSFSEIKTIYRNVDGIWQSINIADILASVEKTISAEHLFEMQARNLLTMDYLKDNFSKIDWNGVAEHILDESRIFLFTFDEEFLEANLPNSTLNAISVIQYLSDEFIERHLDAFDEYNLAVHQKLSNSFLHRHPDAVDWSAYIDTHYPDEDFIEEFWHDISDDGLITFFYNNAPSEEFILKHIDFVEENHCINSGLGTKYTMEFLNNYANRLQMNWEHISMFQSLTTEFMEAHADKVDWRHISRYQKLSEGFMEKHADKLDWNMIAQYQVFSNDFCNANKDRLPESLLNENNKLAWRIAQNKLSDDIVKNLIARNFSGAEIIGILDIAKEKIQTRRDSNHR